MSFSLVPKYAFRDVTDITPEFLKSIDVRFLMLDLDNTLATYGTSTPPGDVTRWASKMEAGGIRLYLVSNNHRKSRVAAMAGALGAGFILGAGKPRTGGIVNAMSETGFTAKQSALAGDQIFTDTLAANRAGVISIVVKPLDRKNPFFSARYILELPFRALCKNKNPAV